ncbi:MAG: hypothetical protein KF760_14865 [Candidatus Eremiobacteraeota bacterium]|nr:hypothetical protein [Candidatus Eremiobacteraeota bacterium]MCW5869822.1 hypothetical protein [Candidatus Eremiobacteraeota bacterium]
MANNSGGFNVGGTPLDRNQYNPQVIRKLTEAAGKVPLEGNKAKTWNELADTIEEKDEVSQEDFDSFRSFAKEVRQERRDIRKRAPGGYRDPKVAAALVPLNVFDTKMNKLTEAHRLTTAKAAVAAASGASFGAANLVTAYHAYANLPKSGLNNLVQAMESEPGKLSFAGNKVEQVHQENLWRSMNNLLDEGSASAKAGKPVEINAQYYELTSQAIIGKLADNAEAGNKVRVNVDPGHLLPYKGTTLDADDLPDKLRGLLQLADAPGDVAISMYPVNKHLGSGTDLMHRKGLRVGDKFLLSGMNANGGSGENVDAGYVIEGPAARKLVQNFSRDVQNSKDSTLEDLYGDKGINGLLERDVRMGRRGLVGLADALDGPEPAGTEPARPKTYAQLQGYFKERGFDLDKFIDLPADEKGPHLDNAIAENRSLPLSDYGKRRLNDLIKLVHKEVHSPENQKRLDDVTAPSDAPKGTSVVSLADTPTEREQLLLQSINEAEKFIYVPAFVITRPVAAALAAKAKDMETAGRKIDIKVLADPGIYPDGGTPNSWGVKFLEDNNIPVRWAALPRTGQHDRKVHAKELLTDKSDFVGSTNFSNKGLRENHEHSGAIHFNPDDPLSVRQQQQAKSSFEELWNDFSVESNSLQTAQRWKKNYQGADKEYQIEDARGSAIRRSIRGIDTYEKESGKWVSSQIEELNLNSQVQELMTRGYDEGNARLKALRDAMGPKEFLQGLHSLPSYQALHGQ